jgi:hypothetical protein
VAVSSEAPLTYVVRSRSLLHHLIFDNLVYTVDRSFRGKPRIESKVAICTVENFSVVEGVELGREGAQQCSE